MSLIPNEQTKLTATFLNNVAMTIVGAGLIAPFFALLYGVGSLERSQLRFIGVAGPIWLLVGIVLHLGARTLLKGLKE